jgi:hypothetical protein
MTGCYRAHTYGNITISFLLPASGRKHIALLRQTVSQLKISDFCRETFEGFEVLYFSMSATTTKLLSSDEFYKLCYDTTPVQSVSANVSFDTNNSKMSNFEL